MASMMSNGRPTYGGQLRFSALEMLEECEESSYESENDVDSNEAIEIDEQSESPQKKADAA